MHLGNNKLCFGAEGKTQSQCPLGATGQGESHTPPSYTNTQKYK